jgi:hypothetical protein
MRNGKHLNLMYCKFKTFCMFAMLITCIGIIHTNSYCKNIATKGGGQTILTDTCHEHTSQSGFFRIMNINENFSLENIEGEEWADIDFTNGIYQVSNMGRVKRTSKEITTSNGKKYKPKEHIIKLSTDNRKSKGYKMACICINNIKRSYTVHRLVAKAFIPNPENKKEVNHKNGITSDNRASELEWVTRSENEIHAWKVLNRSHPNKKTINKIDPISGKVVATYPQIKELLKEYPNDANKITKGFARIIRLKRLFNGFYYEYNDSKYNN